MIGVIKKIIQGMWWTQMADYVRLCDYKGLLKMSSEQVPDYSPYHLPHVNGQAIG